VKTHCTHKITGESHWDLNSQRAHYRQGERFEVPGPGNERLPDITQMRHNFMFARHSR
jgi:hypothetical protein